ncbi:hypothetical protein DASC09_038640 [Saccharomycopsis crataegensis]|uniref:BTB domain-containing protein n=1 Tax=Saccharomycopsis crataegensis TaxID=43959 RepID=A0AAV5QQ46_9ASCO|nr:hypothetical protein DASC09_038640 [Saccharomycopsis crataegensis]
MDSRSRHHPLRESSEGYKSGSYRLSTSKTCAYGCCKKTDNILEDFLHKNGFLQGFCSDITVKAFDKEYNLHKLILSRAGYFRALFLRWSDDDSKCHELLFDSIHDNINRTSFELAIGGLYGGTDKIAEEALATNMISTGQFLDIPELVCNATDYIVSDLSFDTLRKYTLFAYSHNLGTPSERILDSARGLLCIEGYEKGVASWDGLPTDLIVDVVSNDSFFVPTEWDRCLFIIKLIEKRIKVNICVKDENSVIANNESTSSISIEENDLSGTNGLEAPLRDLKLNKKTVRPAKSMYMNNYNNDRVIPLKSRSSSFSYFGTKKSNANSSFEDTQSVITDVSAYDEDDDELYFEEISKLKHCLCKSVYFCHLSFEQLQILETLTDANGEPFVDSMVLRDALWVQSTLHRLIVSTPKSDSKLNITKLGESQPGINGFQPPWYKVPVKDETVYGSPKNLDAIIDEKQKILETVNDDPEPVDIDQREKEEYLQEDDDDSAKSCDTSGDVMTSKLDSNDSQYQSKSSLLENIMKQHSKKINSRKLYKWSKYPPFRFSVAFCDISNLDTEKRLYGKVLWYAGCYWNLYIQKIKKHKKFQLGVYLHRASNPGPPKNGYINQDIFKSYDIVNGLNTNETIGEQFNNAVDLQNSASNGGLSTVVVNEDDALPNSTLDSLGLNNDEVSMNLSSQFGDYTNSEEVFATANNSQISRRASALDSIDPKKYVQEKDKSIPSYEDKRSQISVYFIIRTPSEKTKSSLICFTSSPSLFSTSQSWGWKSNSMCTFNEDGSLSLKDKKYLKFMVTLGTV